MEEEARKASINTSDLHMLVDGNSAKILNQPQNGKKGFRKMYIAALASLMYCIAMGMAATYSATATEDMKRKTSIVIPTDDEISWIGSLLAIGALFGGVIASYMCGQFGRKGTLLISTVPFLTGWLFIAYATRIWHILVGRVFSGFCAGLVCVTVPAYLIEIATPEIRGFLGTCFQLLTTCGGLLVASLGNFTTWNWQALAGAIVVVTGVLMLSPMPESPRWLVEKKKYKEAVKAITFLQGNHVDATSELTTIREELNLLSGDMKIRDIRHPNVYKPMLLSMGLLFFQQSCGGIVILFYTDQIFDEAGSTLSSNVATTIVNIVIVCTTAVASLLMDKAGRRPLLLISSAGMGLSLMVLAIYVYMKPHYEVLQSTYSWIPLACIIFNVLTMSLGIGPIPWMMTAEMSPLKYRSFIMGVTTISCWVSVFTVTKTFTDLLNIIHDYGTYSIYAGFCVLSCFFTLLLPETKGKTMEEIQKEFEPKNRQPIL